MKQTLLKSWALLLLMMVSMGAWADTGDVYTKISEVSSLADGDVIIFVNQAGTHAMSTTQNTNNRGVVAITTSNNSYTKTATDNVQELVIRKVNNAFGFHTGSGYLYSASTSSNYLKTNSSAVTVTPSGTTAWNISISNSVCSITNATNTSFYMAFNGTTIFSQYKQNQTKPYIYKKVSGSSKAPSNLSFGSTTEFEINLGDPFSEPTLTAADNSILTKVRYASSNETVATVNEATGKIKLNGREGTTEITASFEGDETYASGLATYTINVTDPNKRSVTFDLSSNGYNWPSTNDGSTYFDGSTYTPAVEGQITMSVSGNVRMWGTTESSLRLYAASVGTDPNTYNYGLGTIVLDAAAGYAITKITVTGSNLTFNPSLGTFANGEWAGYATSVSLAKGSNTPQIKTVTVEYCQIPDFSVTTTDTDFYSLFLNHAVTIPSNVTAYKGTLNGLTLNLEPIEGTIPANTGVLFKTTEAGTANFVACADAPALENNDIKGVAVDTRIADIPESTGKKVLVLGMVDGKVGFAQPADGATTIAANKAYILVPESAGHAPAVRIFVDEETGIETVKTCEAETGVLYNLQGQRVNANAKGLLIVNGKKVLVK